MKRFLALLLIATPVITLTSTPASAFECHTALVLALDASRSVDRREHDLQRRGLAEALRDPDIIAALAPAQNYGAIAMAFEWSNPGTEVVLAPWPVLDGREAIHNFATELEQGPEIEQRMKTGLGSAMKFAAEARAAAPTGCARYVIDISGDGPGNAGTHPAGYRATGLFDGLLINGLVIRHPSLDSAQPPNKDPLPYYQTHVIQGPGAFVEVVDSYDDYPAVIRRKLLRELSPSLAVLK
jgi:Ca-activated chloride channel family protein